MIAGIVLATALVLTQATAVPPTDITDRQIADSVTPLAIKGSITPFQSVRQESGRTTINLSSDILFDVDQARLPASAAARLAGLLDDVPRGAGLRVEGHTDSRVGAVPNQKLSEQRARAVSDAVKLARPDLKQVVKGFAATRPAVPEKADDPATFEANRRVEMIYTN